VEILLEMVLSLALSLSLYGQDKFNLEKQNLEEAIKQIASKSNMPYLVDGKLLKGKTSPKLENIEGTKNALDKALEGTGLEATIENNIIIIKQKVLKSSGTVLEPISIGGDSFRNGTAESGYLVEDITGVGLWGKRSLQDTPYSMTVITSDLIENIQANDMVPIFKINPITQNNSTPSAGIHSPIIRGFNVNNPVINGMPIANWYSFTTMEDLERVETISGATGFLYGGGRVGGAVNYVTKKPTLEDKRSITLGNYGGEQYYGHIDLSGQIDEKKVFGYRINALYQDGDSVADVGKEQKFVSLAFDYKPTDNFTMDLNYAHRELENTNRKPTFFIEEGIRPKIDVSKGYGADWASNEEKNDRVISSLKWNLNDIFTLRSSLLYEKSNEKFMGNQEIVTRKDGLYDVYNNSVMDPHNQYESYSGNIYLDSKFETLGVNHLLTVGYSKNYYKYSSQAQWVDSSEIGVTLDKAKNSLKPTANISNKGLQPFSKSQYNNILIGDDIVFNDQWSTLIGANYATVIQTSYSNGIQSSKYDKSELTPTLSLMYKPFDDLTTYVTQLSHIKNH
jgi:iron complex outermembrane receptor protein